MRFYVLLSKESGTNARGSLQKDPAEVPGLNKRARAVKTMHSKRAKKVKREKRESSGKRFFFFFFGLCFLPVHEKNRSLSLAQVSFNYFRFLQFSCSVFT